MPSLRSAFGIGLSCAIGLACSPPQETARIDAQSGTDRGGSDADRFWPQWRGPLGTGVAPHADPPLEWSETSNVRWKTAIPGLGHSTPVVWGTRIFLTAAIPVGDVLEAKPETAPGAHDNVPVTRRRQLVALALDRSDGKILWQRNLREWLPHESRHHTGSYAAASPVVDAERLYAFFGSGGLFCLDHDGYLLWQADLGQMQVKHAHGEGGSPALHGETVVVNWDHEGDSFVVAFDASTGEERWKVTRDEVTSWATPLIVEQAAEVQVVISASDRVRAYDLADGKVVWECAGMSHNVVATPVAGDGMLFAASSYDRQALLAIRLEGARGDISKSDHVVWYRRRSTPYVPSPLLYGEALYFLHHYQGKLSRVVAATGEEPYRPLRLDGLDDIYASPVGAAGRLYVVDRSGEVAVLSHEPQPKVLARNILEDRFSASPVLVERDLYLRGERFLYCIAEEQPGK